MNTVEQPKGTRRHSSSSDVRITRQKRVDYAYELKELYRRRELIKNLTFGLLKSGHREMVLGQLWWLLEPILSMLIYVFLVQIIFKRGIENYAVFIFCAILPYRWFTQSVAQGQGVITGLGALMREVAFPKAVYPIALTLSNFMNFLFGFLFLGCLIWYFDVPVTIQWLWLPALLLQFMVFTLGVSLLVSGFTVLFRDLKNIMSFVFQILFYMSPILYPVSYVPERFRPIYELSPFCIMFTAWRDVLLHGRAPDVTGLLIVSALSVALLALGYSTFVRLEKLFPKIL